MAIIFFLTQIFYDVSLDQEVLLLKWDNAILYIKSGSHQIIKLG